MFKTLTILVVMSILCSVIPASGASAAANPIRFPQVDDTLLASYTFPGEKVFTVYPGLEYQGVRYLVHYFTTGDYSNITSRFIYVLSETFLENQSITGMLVTADGYVVEDEDTIRNVLALYRAAYYLYEEANSDWLGYVPDGLADEMHTLASITQFITLNFPDEYDDTAEALRQMFSSRLAAPPPMEEFGSAVADLAEDGQSVVGAVDSILENTRFSNNKSVRLAGDAIRESFSDWYILPEEGSQVSLAGKVIHLSNGLKLISLGSDLMWLTEIQSDRADWLVHYQGFASGEATLSPDQSLAASTVITESENQWAQRVNLIIDFVEDEAFDWLVAVGEDVLVKEWTKYAFNKYGTRIVGHIMAGLASNVLLGITIGNLIYGLDDVNECFWLGIRMDDLRARFRAGRIGLEEQVRIQSVPYYDGELSEDYRSAYMLESLAAARMLSSYADGVDATVRDGLTALINPIKWFVGDDWQEAAQELRELSVQSEQEAEDNVGHPAFIDAAVASIFTRINQIKWLVDDSSSSFIKYGPDQNWEMMEGGYAGSATWTHNEAVALKNSGRWQIDVPEAGLYRIELYIPQTDDPNLGPYTRSAMVTLYQFDRPVSYTLDMQQAEGGWLELGVHYLEGDGEEYVQLGDLTSEPAGEAILVFDALRLTHEDVRDEHYQATSGSNLIYEIALPGETVNLDLTVTNSGLMPWRVEDGYTFQPEGTLNATLPIFPINQTVLPGDSLAFSVDVSLSSDASSGLETIHYAVTRSGIALDEPVTAHIFILPQQLADYRDELEKKIDEWLQEGKQTIEDLIQTILDDIKRELAEQVEKQVNQWFSQCFSSSSLILGGLAVVVIRRRKGDKFNRRQ